MEASIEVPDKKETLDIDRKDMPQIKSSDVQDFLKYLKKNNVSTEKKLVDPSDLKATQGQFHKEKIKDLMNAIEAGKLKKEPILVSKDNYVIDGHHRWLAFNNLGRDITIYRVNMNAEDLIRLMKYYSKSFTEKLYEAFELMCEDKDTCPILTVAHMKAFEQFVDRMFKKFNIDFEFTKHFRERMSDERNDPCIDMKELAQMIQKIYKKYQNGDKSLSKFVDAEVVIKDLQSDLNMPIAIEYDRKIDEIDVIAKTIMRKKNFRTPNPEIKI